MKICSHQYQRSVDCPASSFGLNGICLKRYCPELNEEAIFPAEPDCCWIHHDRQMLWSDESVSHSYH